MRFVNAPLTWNNFLSRALDFKNPSCYFHVKGLFASRGGNMRDSISAEVLEPAAFGSSVLLNKSLFSRPFISHVPFDAVPPQPSIRRSIWTVVHWLFWLSFLYVCEYLHLSIMCHGMLKGVGCFALLGGYKNDCCMFLSNSDHQDLIQDLEIVCPWILKHSPICPRRQQGLKICLSMNKAEPDSAKTDLCKYWLPPFWSS